MTAATPPVNLWTLDDKTGAAIGSQKMGTPAVTVGVPIALAGRASVWLTGGEMGREMPNANLTHAEFERVVSEALESLPKRFADLVENVVIAVEDEPTAEDLESIADDSNDDTELLGIYRGVALTERTHDMPLLPDEIAVFRGPINRVTRTRDEAMLEVRETVIHELGHYFGLEDKEMPH